MLGKDRGLVARETGMRRGLDFWEGERGWRLNQLPVGNDFIVILCDEASPGTPKEGVWRASTLGKQSDPKCSCAGPQTPRGQRRLCSEPPATYPFTWY